MPIASPAALTSCCACRGAGSRSASDASTHPSASASSSQRYGVSPTSPNTNRQPASSANAKKAAASSRQIALLRSSAGQSETATISADTHTIAPAGKPSKSAPIRSASVSRPANNSSRPVTSSTD